ncbi:MAG: hypothetical protein QW234_01425 [Nitrososphaerota archaeon]
MGEWLSRRLGTLYAKLYRKFGSNTFTSNDVAEILGSEGGPTTSRNRVSKGNTM